MLRYASVLILAMATAAPALAQLMSLTASVSVTWITDTDGEFQKVVLERRWRVSPGW